MKTYKAVYNVEFFERKTKPSYALWAVKIRDGNNPYPKIPTGYGRCETLVGAREALTKYCQEQNLNFEDLRLEPIPWMLVKDLLDGKNGAEYFARQIKRNDAEYQARTAFVDQLVFEAQGVVWADSVRVADKFRKRHADVIRAIENLPNDEFRQRNFALTMRDVLGPKKAIRQEPAYKMTWKGFSMLAMGFTGQRAYEWKRSFLDAFEALGVMINRRRAMRDTPEWQQARLEGKVQRLEETDVIKEFIDYARARGSEHADWYYKSFTAGIYKALFVLEQGGKWTGLRDRLPAPDLNTLATAERIAQKYIHEGMMLGMEYKAIYKYAIAKVEDFVEIMGQARIPAAQANILKLK